jgi:hypothetical protein
MVIANSSMIRNILHESRVIRLISNLAGSFFMRLPPCSCAGSDPFPCGYCLILSLGQVGTTPAWAAQNILLLQLSELLHLFRYARGSLSGGIMHSLVNDYAAGLLGSHEPPCLSLYQPTHRHHPDNRQDPIRFRNLVKALEQSLRQKYTAREVQRF